MKTTDQIALSEQQETTTIKRVFDLPPAVVWKAWTEAESFKKWWGPKEYTCPACSIDFKTGGKYVACMRSADGKDTWVTGIYKEIIPGSKIVYTDSFADKDGNVVGGAYYAMPQMPWELLVTLDFEEVAGKTSMTLQHAGLPADMAADCIKGWQSSFDKLEANVK
jgi:uncharacterized protein YndB with AHSA1/START domain